MARWRWCGGRITKRDVVNGIKSILLYRPAGNNDKMCDCLEKIEVSQSAKLYDASPCLARDIGETECTGMQKKT